MTAFDLDCIKTAAAVIAATSAIFAAFQLRIARVNLELQQRARLDTHERARREKAVSLIREFCASISPAWSAVRQLVEQLDDDCLRALDRGDPMEVKAALVIFVKTALPQDLAAKAPADSTVVWQLDRQQVAHLRTIAFSYLNFVEMVCAAAYHDVADRTIILQQMKSFYNPSERRTLMEHLRNVSGGREVFPCIYTFVDELNARTIAPPAPIAAEVVS